MYNPADPTGTELITSNQNDDFEFIELRNVSHQDIDLSGVRFTKGVDFDFSDNTILASGANILVVKDIAAFEARYGLGHPVAGSYGGDNLSNGGEQLKLSLGVGTAILDFTYSTSEPWPSAADGSGFSLTLINPSSLPDHTLASSWRISSAINGSPNATDLTDYETWATANTVSGGSDGDDDGDGISNLMEFALASDPHTPSLEDLPQSSIIDGLLILTFTKTTAADNLSSMIEFSSDLVNWDSTSAVRLSSIPSTNGTSFETWRFTTNVTSSPKILARLKVITN